MKNEHYILRAKLIGLEAYVRSIVDFVEILAEHASKIPSEETKGLGEEVDTLIRNLILFEIGASKRSFDKPSDSEIENGKLHSQVEGLVRIKQKLELDIQKLKSGVAPAVENELTEAVNP